MGLPHTQKNLTVCSSEHCTQCHAFQQASKDAKLLEGVVTVPQILKYMIQVLAQPHVQKKSTQSQ